MKKQFLIAIGLFFALGVTAQQDPILMQINGKPVTKSDYLQIYLKNNNDPKFDKASLDEYMELFKKFKLKVAEAEAQRYDTIPKLKRELEGYKKQLALPYLVDSAKNEALVREAAVSEERAMLASDLSPQAYFEESLSGKKRKELRRQLAGFRLLRAQGDGARSTARPAGPLHSHAELVSHLDNMRESVRMQSSATDGRWLQGSVDALFDRVPDASRASSSSGVISPMLSACCWCR